MATTTTTTTTTSSSSSTVGAGGSNSASGPLQHGIVKSIISGDTILIRPLPRGDEKRIGLNYITAPKLARPPSDNSGGATVDEPYAFECREFLRKKLVGKEICYTVDFVIPNTGRTVCTVWLGKDSSGENVIESLLAEGLAELRTQQANRSADPRYARMAIIDEQAKLTKRGRYSDEPVASHVRDIKWTLENPKAFVDAHKHPHPPLDAIVEFVRDGNTCRCLLLPSYHLVTVMLTGIKCPVLKRENSVEPNEPYAEEAKQFVESRLHQRQVKVSLESANNANIVGTLLHPNGNIALHLLKEGLAKCVDWSLTLLPAAHREKYRATEKYAKDHRLRIWQNYVPQQAFDDGSSEGDGAANGGGQLRGYQAKVFEVINGDGLMVRDLRDNKVKKIFLSSVRAPRAADLQQQSDGASSRVQIKRPLYEIPFLFEARELLRKRLIGKQVRVVTDYIQPASSDYPEKVCCTVYAGNVNMGEALISKGLCKTLRHRQDDEQRSSRYDDLLTAEQQAEKKLIGLFSPNQNSGVKKVVDMTGEGNKERAKNSLSVLQRNGRMEGIVEFVASGSRFRVHLLKDNWLISFLLSSVNCPRAERRITTANGQQRVEPAEPFGTEALNFAKDHFLQRDVIVEIESTDRGGNFIGRMTTADGQSVAFLLVQAGLAKLHDMAYNNAPNFKQLEEAEEACKKARIGVWSTYEEPTAKEGDLEEVDAESSQDDQSEGSIQPATTDFSNPRFRHVAVTYMTNDLKIFVQHSDSGPKLEQLQSDLQDALQHASGGHVPKKNELLAARFTGDDQWYRARVEKIEAGNRVSVYFVDYGNGEIITDTNRLAVLPQGFSLSTLPAQVHECELAFIKPPPDEDDRSDAKEALAEDIGQDECLIKVEYRQNNVEHVSLYKASTKENIGKLLVQQGLVCVNPPSRSRQQLRTSPVLEELLHAQTEAKTSRLGLWQYSDQIEDDANEFGFTGRK